MVVAVAVAVAVAEKNTKTHGKNGKMKVATFFCHQVGQIWSYRAVIFFPCSKSRDLGPEHGFRACSFKNKREMLGFHFFGVKQTKQIGKFGRNRLNVGLQSSRPDQKDPQDRRGYFCKIWACGGNQNVQLGVGPGLSAQDVPVAWRSRAATPRANLVFIFRNFKDF